MNAEGAGSVGNTAPDGGAPQGAPVAPVDDSMDDPGDLMEHPGNGDDLERADSREPEDGQAGPPAGVLARAVKVGLLVVGALAVLGALVLWPRGGVESPTVGSRVYVDATIGAVEEEGSCPGLDEGTYTGCILYGARLSSGPDRGEVVVFSVPPVHPGIPDLAVGDDVVLQELAGAPPELRYHFVDYQRSTPLLWLGAAFVVVVVLFGGWQGLRALAGLGLSLLVLALFIVPALLRDSPALPVALVGAALVAFCAIYLAHGVNLASSVALAGTLVSLAFTALLAVVVAGLAHLTGLAGEEARSLRVTSEALDLRGLLIAGIVIGALGVLDDVTVSQVSTVSALRRAAPTLPAIRLYREAVRVGRDHVAAAVNTLVLAYAGAALPLLLLFAQGTDPLGRLVTSEVVAVEVVRMLVGSIGLVLSVPITTGLAVAVFGRDERVEVGS